MNEVYQQLWCLAESFCPSLKLKQKQREGAKIIKKYPRATNAYQRVLGHPDIPESQQLSRNTMPSSIHLLSRPP